MDVLGTLRAALVRVEAYTDGLDHGELVVIGLEREMGQPLGTPLLRSLLVEVAALSTAMAVRRLADLAGAEERPLLEALERRARRDLAHLGGDLRAGEGVEPGSLCGPRCWGCAQRLGGVHLAPEPEEASPPSPAWTPPPPRPALARRMLELYELEPGMVIEGWRLRRYVVPDSIAGERRDGAYWGLLVGKDACGDPAEYGTVECCLGDDGPPPPIDELERAVARAWERRELAEIGEGMRDARARLDAEEGRAS
jgi:hypothetical protein